MKYNFKCCLIIFLLLVIGWCSLGNPIRENLDTKDHTNDNDNLNRDHDTYRNGYESRYDDQLQPMNLRGTGIGDNGANGVLDSQITDENRDLYILKSSTVPPVCTNSQYNNNNKNNNNGSNDDDNKCPPCPPCARCPEPAFECKKVPNYNSSNNSFLPKPLLNDFSQF